ncbi:hypothetical protein BDR04DRAFT_1148915 [Suillus decipiens]|nr:hypothetical protein BDR04DRAFT_1148915 [Suillus decipiens]
MPLLVRHSITHSHQIVTFPLFTVPLTMPLTMPLTIPHEFKPLLCNGDNAITATDACSLTYDGQLVFTSPNMTFVPQLYDNPSDIVQVRADGKFWAMDPFQWPQMYADAYTWSFTIP